METLLSDYAIVNDRQRSSAIAIAEIEKVLSQRGSWATVSNRQRLYGNTFEIYPTMHLLAYFVILFLDVNGQCFDSMSKHCPSLHCPWTQVHSWTFILHSMAQSPDTETLIAEIQKYECLYNRYSKEYKDKCKKMKAWIAVSNKFGLAPFFVRHVVKQTLRYYACVKKITTDHNTRWFIKEPWTVLER